MALCCITAVAFVFVLAILSNFIHWRVIERKKQKHYTINTKIQSIYKIIKRSLVCSLQNKLYIRLRKQQMLGPAAGQGKLLETFILLSVLINSLFVMCII